VYKSRTIFLITAAYNEEGKIGEVVRRTPRDIVDTVFVVDDGSTDATADEARRYGAEVVSLNRVYGAGFSVRLGLREAQRRGIDIAVVIAGNNKDAPEEITRLLDPICDARCDFVIGSRISRRRRVWWRYAAVSEICYAAAPAIGEHVLQQAYQ
jgi:glycosyltransferase involved in cell wall biosynthesis